MNKKYKIVTGIVILLVGIIALFFDNPVTATLCVPIGVSLIIFSKIISLKIQSEVLKLFLLVIKNHTIIQKKLKFSELMIHL